MKDKIIKCSIHKGILENPVQCINCKKYCCKDCIDNYYNKYCPFCNNEKNYYPDIKLHTDLKSRFRKCENCEIYFERIHFEKHKFKCGKKIINCYFCNFVGTKEKFLEHINKKHKKILINDFKDIFGNNNQNNNNYSDINNVIIILIVLIIILLKKMKVQNLQKIKMEKNLYLKHQLRIIVIIIIIIIIIKIIII